MSNVKNVVIYGGGIRIPVFNHFSICAFAGGNTARQLAEMYQSHPDCNMDIHLKISRIGGGDKSIDTITDLENDIDRVTKDPSTRIVIMSAAVPNYAPSSIYGSEIEFSDHLRMTEKYINSLGKDNKMSLDLERLPRVVKNVRKERKDVFLVLFKTVANESRKDAFEQGLKLMKTTSANLVFVNDIVRKDNFIITPEESTYGAGNREDTLRMLVDMSIARSHLAFTRSNVVSAVGVPWSDERVPSALRSVVDWCIAKNAYKPGYEGSGSTVGHFAVKLGERQFLTSKRKSDFRKMNETGLVYVETDGNDYVTAYGGKPSVGGQSQRIIFEDHPGLNCIVHFHCPLKSDYKDDIPVASQFENECGSHQCGQNTSNNLRQVRKGIWAVMLDNHGPNIVFSDKDTTSEEVISFIEDNFSLADKTLGYILE
jgi:hypothetical protein